MKEVLAYHRLEVYRLPDELLLRQGVSSLRGNGIYWTFIDLLLHGTEK